MITVLLVDDHALVRRGLEQLLNAAPDIEVVGSAANGEAAVDLVESLTPDVVLMDLLMPGIGGVEATRLVLERLPGTQVVVLTSFSDRERIVKALDAGATGYLLKDVEPDELVEGIRATARGESPLHPKAARELLLSRTAAPTEAERAATSLTPREVEVLHGVREGLANKQIARRMGISERTVKAHLTSAFARIGVSDRTQAALYVERHL